MKFAPVKAEPAADLREITLFRAENFPASNVRPWLDEGDWRERVERDVRAGDLDVRQADLCRHWAQSGYVVVRGMFSAAELDRAWDAYERAIATGAVQPQSDYGQAIQNRPGRVLNPHFKVREFDAILRAACSVDLVSLLLGATALPFQTIAGHIGSQQKAHSDSIHMTTYPEGFLIANWIAFEDISPDSGPLEFYPGSHRLPYLYSSDCNISPDEGLAGYSAYHEKYESAVQNAIDTNGLASEYFHATKGDVLFWHANLLHGGSTIRNTNSSRRALVCHYFTQGCICYHDYTGSPSHLTQLPKRPILRRVEFDPVAYLRFNPDVAAAGMDAWQHYLRHGHAEGRRTK